MEVEIGEDLLGRNHIASLGEGNDIVVNELIILASGECHGSGICILNILGLDRAHCRSLVGGLAGHVVVLREVRTGGVRVLHHIRFTDGSVVEEVHLYDTHVAVDIELYQITLREVVGIVHHGRGAADAFPAGRLDGHIPCGSTSESRPLTLPEGTRIVDREVEVAVERDNLRIFLKHACKNPCGPVVRQSGSPDSAVLTKETAVDRVVDHRVRQHNHVPVRISLRDGIQLLVKPSDDVW